MTKPAGAAAAAEGMTRRIESKLALKPSLSAAGATGAGPQSSSGGTRLSVLIGSGLEAIPGSATTGTRATTSSTVGRAIGRQADQASVTECHGPSDSAFVFTGLLQLYVAK